MHLTIIAVDQEDVRCLILLTTYIFTSHMTGKNFKISIVTSYKSFRVISSTKCKRCGQQYVGKTGQPLNVHLRMNVHCHNITHRRTKDSTVEAHFNHNTHTHSLADMTVMVN